MFGKAPKVAVMLQSSLQKALLYSQRHVGKVLVAIVASLWVWKAMEIAGRETGLLRRNLGWGYVVNLTIPIAATAALGVFFAARWVTRRLSGRRS
jgi:hypothetical protein